MISLSLKSRTFLLAFVPILLITVILAFYFIKLQLNDIDKAITDRGSSMAKHLANASEYGIFSGNKDYLNTLLQSSIIDDDVISITVLDKSGNLFTSLSNTNSTSYLPVNQANSRVFRHPIILHTTDVLDINSGDEAKNAIGQDDILGWLEVSLSTSQLMLKRNQTILDASIIILVGLLASSMLAIWMGKSLTDPIIRLTNAVNRIEEGHLDESIDTTSSGEIGFLEKGILSMLGKMRITQQDLQNKVDETTNGLRNSLRIVEKQNLELTEARFKALESSQAKSRFMANISHELRTPMNGILGFTRLLKESTLNKKQIDYITTIEKSADNLLHLIEDILDISSIEVGKIQVQNKKFNLYDCISDVITLLSPSINDKGLEVSFNYYSDTPRIINAPYDRIRQVVINLLGNSIKFSDKGTITIRVMLDPDESKSDSILISVSDEGIGISEKDIDKLFKPFSQIDDSSTREHSGTGLGLAISKSIVKAMGGEMGLESTPGKGARFWFTFCHYPNISINDNTLTSNYLDWDFKSLDDVKILVAEDNPINSKLISSILSDLGAELTLVTNGKDAVSAFHTEYFDLILMDIQMPVMNGLDSAKIIRNSSKKGNEIPIIGVTANAMQDDINYYKQSGFSGFLVKPISVDNLVTLICSFVNKGAGARSTNLDHNDQEHLDRLTSSDSELVNHLGVKKELSRQLLNMLKNDLPSISQEIQDSFNTRNWELLRAQIHKLLGGVCYCNVPDLQEIILSFQSSLKNKSDTMESDYRKLLIEIDKLTNDSSIST